MQVTVLPASSNVGEETVRQLLASSADLTVRAVYRNIDKAPEEFKSNPRFKAVRGDVGTGDLDLDASEAVLYVPPMVLDGTDLDEFAARAAQNVKEAIERAGTVKRLVVQSALGSHLKGIGVLRLNTITDNILRDATPRTFIVQPSTFFSTWKRALLVVRDGADSFPSYLSSPDWKVPMVSILDIASYCVKAILDTDNNMSTQVVKLYGPRLYSPNDVRAAIAEATGKPVKIEPVAQENLPKFWSGHIPERYAADLTEFTVCQLEGGIMVGEYEYDERTVKGTRELIDDFKRWVS